MSQEQLGFLAFALAVLLATPLYVFTGFKDIPSRVVYLLHYLFLLFLSAISAIPFIIWGVPGIISVLIAFFLKKAGRINYEELKSCIVIYTTVYGLSPAIMFCVVSLLSLLGEIKGSDNVSGMVILFVPVTAVVGFMALLVMLFIARTFFKD
ncbi:MAG: hypothetical protein AUJ12_05265 [Alphaproteobacteria bacterium CG1_02_46_17]|nr:MAG: hypothetical protein AUJ12_05265 [Alphaproteobacteria bacterium CG1_02_46_17]